VNPICVNELSFVGQAHDLYHAAELLVGLVDTLKVVLSAFRIDNITGHSKLWEKNITPTHSVNRALYECSLPLDERTLLLTILKNGPFVDFLINSQEIDCSCRIGGIDVSFSGIAGSAHFGGCLVSLPEAQGFSDHSIGVVLCQPDPKQTNIKNFTSIEQVDPLLRRYIPSEKHQLGGWGTLMELDDVIAQQVLDSGVVYGRKIYGLHSGQYEVDPGIRTSR